jgi:2-oxoglutarate dehydrogenase E1 component
MLSRRVVGRFIAVTRSLHPPPSVRGLASLAQSPSANDIFANGTNAYYADEMYRLWKQDPKSVHPSWNVYFSGLANGLSSQEAFHPPPTITSHHLPHPADGAPALHIGQGAQLDDHLKVCGIIS